MGAPFEQGKKGEAEGAIYVFMGRDSGIRVPYSQKLTPNSMKSYTLRGLGISFSRPQDVDDNQYPGKFMSQ